MSEKAPKKPYTASELREFDRITMKLSSARQMARIEGRMEIKRFIEKHGQAKCDAMFKALTGKEAQN